MGVTNHLLTGMILQVWKTALPMVDWDRWVNGSWTLGEVGSGKVPRQETTWSGIIKGQWWASITLYLVIWGGLDSYDLRQVSMAGWSILAFCSKGLSKGNQFLAFLSGGGICWGGRLNSHEHTKQNGVKKSPTVKTRWGRGGQMKCGTKNKTQSKESNPGKRRLQTEQARNRNGYISVGNT